MRKRERQATIQRLIQSEPIERQEDLDARGKAAARCG